MSACYRILPLSLAAVLLSCGEYLPSPRAIGTAPPPVGEHRLDGSAVVLSGPAGWGVERSLPSGDCTIVLRFTALTGRIAIEAVAEGSPPTVFTIAPGKNEDVTADQSRFVRMAIAGRNTGYWVGRDGIRWLNRMGGFRLDGTAPIRLRLGCDDRGLSSARIEVTVQSGLQLANRTDWFANTLTGSVRETVNLNMTSLAVAPDGSCLVTSSFEEQGHCTAIYRDGRQLAPDRKNLASLRASAWHGDHGYVAVKQGVQRVNRQALQEGKAAELGKDIVVTGLAADGREVFAAIRAIGVIVVLDAATMKEARRLSLPDAGRLALAPDGSLWATVETYEDIYRIPYAQPGAVVRLDRTTGQELARITDVVVPTALAFDPRGRLLVAENGPDQQVRIYDVAGAPRLAGTVGRKGGMQASKGAVEDYVFNGITGIGCDAAGNLYVAQTGWPYRYVMSGMMANATSLVALPAAALTGTTPPARWKLESQSYIFDGATLDPQDPTSAYGGADQRYRLDWSATGNIGTWAGFLIDHARFPEEGLTRRTRCSPFVRHLDGQRFLFLAGKPGLVVYRFESGSEFAIPCVALCAKHERGEPEAWLSACPAKEGQPWIWTDANGDGLVQAAEFTLYPPAPTVSGNRFQPDAAGDLWMTGWNATSPLRWRYTGLRGGVPVYERGEAEAPVPLFASVQWAHYEPGDDSMVLAGEHREYPGAADVWRKTAIAARYRGWLKGERRLEHWFPIYDGDNDFTDAGMGISVLGDLLHVGSRPGNVHIYDLRRGNCVTELTAGPEVFATAGYFDREQSAVQAYRLADGEHVALCQENGWGRIVVHRWRPDPKPGAAPVSAPRLRAQSSSGGALLRWVTPVSGLITGYRIERSTAQGGPWQAAGSSGVASFMDAGATKGTLTWYRVAAVNAVGVGPWSVPVSVTVVAPAAAFVSEDKDTQGDWKGRYGRLAYYIDGDAGPTNPLCPGWLRFDGGLLRKQAGHPSQPGTDPWLPLVSAEGSTARTKAFAGTRFTNRDQTWSFELTDGRTRALTLYFAGHGNGHGQTIEIVDPDSGTVLDRRHTAGRGVGQGRHLTWNVSGRFHVRITKDEKSFSCQLAAIFVDEPR